MRRDAIPALVAAAILAPLMMSAAPARAAITQAADPPAATDRMLGGTDPLSSTLAQTNGVLPPPPTADQDMVAKPPEKGTMPVIKPPAKEGTKVVPK